MEPFLKVGIISSVHGVHGEVKVYPTTDDPARFKALDRVFLRFGQEELTVHIQGVKFFKQMVIVKFREFDAPEIVQHYRNWELFIPREEGVPLSEDENYIADLIGMEVATDEGEVLGTLTDVLETGANDVYVVDTKKYGQVLIPAIKQCIINVNVEAEKMLVHLLPGLTEL